MNCNVIMQWEATPQQTRDLGAALWRWCNRTAGVAGLYQYLDNQSLADLLTGKLPTGEPKSRPSDLPQVQFSVRADSARDRDDILESLRQTLPREGVVDVRVDGRSWLAEAKENPQ